MGGRTPSLKGSDILLITVFRWWRALSSLLDDVSLLRALQSNILSFLMSLKAFETFKNRFPWNIKPNNDSRLNHTPQCHREAKFFSFCVPSPLPWARLHCINSPPWRRKEKGYLFSTFQISFHFQAITLAGHHYRKTPLTENTCFIAHVAMLMAREGMSHNILQAYHTSRFSVWIYIINCMVL